MLRSKFVRAIILCFAVLAISVYGSPKRAPSHSYTDQRFRRAEHHPNYQNALHSPWYENSMYWEPSTVRNHRDLNAEYYSLRSPDYASPYVSCSRPSRSNDATTFPSNFMSMITFDTENAPQYTNSFSADNDAMSPSGSVTSNKYEINDPFQIVESEIDSSEYLVAPSRIRRLYVVPRADIDPSQTFEDNSDISRFSMTMSRSAPKIYNDHSIVGHEQKDTVNKAITTTRQQRQQEDALSYAEANPNRYAEHSRRSTTGIIRPSDIVYVPEVTYNPYNLPSQLNILKMLEMNALASGQKDFKLRNDVTLNNIQTEESTEVNDRRQKNSIGNEKEAHEIASDVSFGEDVSTIKTRDTNKMSSEDFRGKIKVDASDNKLDGDIVLSEILQEGENRERTAKSVDSSSAAKKNDESSSGDLDLSKNAINSTTTSPEFISQKVTEQPSDANNKDKISI